MGATKVEVLQLTLVVNNWFGLILGFGLGLGWGLGFGLGSDIEVEIMNKEYGGCKRSEYLVWVRIRIFVRLRVWVRVRQEMEVMYKEFHHYVLYFLRDYSSNLKRDFK